MLDRLIADHPDVTFQIDETNDYRLFPFESVARGPSWYANGSPTPDQALHNLWTLAPYVPGFTLGQHALGRAGDELQRRLPDGRRARRRTSRSSTTSRRYPAEAVAAARRWIDLYRAERDALHRHGAPAARATPSAARPGRRCSRGTSTRRPGRSSCSARTTPDTTTIALRGIRGDGAYVLRDALTRDVVGTFTADQLRAGIAVTLDAVNTAAVWLVDPA